MKRVFRILLFSLLVILTFSQPALASKDVIKIGFNIPLTGMFNLVGSHSKNAAELVRKELNAAGGLKVGSKVYDVEFLYGDNESNASAAAALTVSQITSEQVVGIVGPLSSRQAIPVGQMSNSFSTPMISPWSTSPITTKDRPFVFRSCFIFPIQGPVITKFVKSEFNATKAAILYDIVSAYPRGMAKSFKESFERINGEDSVVANEEFRTGDEDFSKQLKRIKASGAEFIFTPQHFNEVPLIVRQAKEIGLDIPIIGSNSWAGGDLTGECDGDCDGLFFTGNYAAGGAEGLNKVFVDKYVTAYGENPDEPAALTWDAVRALLQAIQNTEGLSGNLLTDRVAIRDSLVVLKNYDGAAGELNFNESGTPDKCAVIVQIVDGVFTFHDSVCP